MKKYIDKKIKTVFIVAIIANVVFIMATLFLIGLRGSLAGYDPIDIDDIPTINNDFSFKVEQKREVGKKTQIKIEMGKAFNGREEFRERLADAFEERNMVIIFYFFRVIYIFSFIALIYSLVKTRKQFSSRKMKVLRYFAIFLALISFASLFLFLMFRLDSQFLSLLFSI